MKILDEGVRSYLNILGKQAIPQQPLRPNKFCVTTLVDDGILVYHLVTKSLLLLDGPMLTQSEDIQKFLVENWFLVEDDFRENQWFDQFKGLLKLVQRPKNKQGYLIFTTTDCNARCFYCYELGRSRISMSKQTAEDVADYIIAHNRGQRVRLSWFGGEPLFNEEAIDIICNRLQGKVDYYSTMTTNGLLFNPENVKKAVSLWKLEQVQIAMDGTHRVYNRVKAYVNFAGDAYLQVLENIQLLLQNQIAVNIRMNMDSHNAEDLFALAKELSDRFAGMGSFRVYPYMLMETENFVPHADMQQYAKTFEELKDKLLLWGIGSTPKLHSGISLNYCMADDPDSATILPDGKLGRCEYYSDSETYGSIYSADIDRSVLERWKEPGGRIPTCEDCAAYPVCVRLKKCPTQLPCNPILQESMLKDICRGMRAEYDKWRKEQ